MQEQIWDRLLTESEIIELAYFQKYLGIQTEGVDVDTEPIIQAIKYLMKPKGKQQYAALEFQFENQKIAKEESRIAGSFIVSFQSHKVWWIRSAYVKKQYRSQGIFTKMFKRVLKRARSNQIQKIKIYVNRDNSRANDLYYRLGFRPTDQVFYCHEVHEHNKDFLVDSQTNKQEQYTVTQLEYNDVNDSIEMVADPKGANNTNTTEYHRFSQVFEEAGRLLLGLKYYWQFSDWGCGLILCVSSIRVPGPIFQQITNKTIQVPTIMNSLIKNWQQSLQKEKLKLKQIRLIGKSGSKPPILQYFDEGQFYEEDYNILSLDCQ